MNGIRAVQAFRREPRNQEIFDDVNDDYRLANLRAFRLVASFMPGIKLIGNITIAVVLVYGAYLRLPRRGHRRRARGVPALPAPVLRADAGDLAVLQHLPVRLGGAGEALRRARGGAVGARADRPGRARRRPAASCASTTSGSPTSTGRPVLPDLDLTSRPGRRSPWSARPAPARPRWPSWSPGSTTRPRAGSLLDGVDLRDLRPTRPAPRGRDGDPGELPVHRHRRRQHPLRPARAPPWRRSSAAAKAIGAHDFISALPDGYDTDVANRGGRLSAGQRQLVAFARAFLADPAVLILDEATSSLDVPSERLVQRALRTILADRTAIIIAHRLSTVEIADRVLVHGARPDRRGRRARATWSPAATAGSPTCTTPGSTPSPSSNARSVACARNRVGAPPPPLGR